MAAAKQAVPAVGTAVKWLGREGVNSKATWHGVVLAYLPDEERIVVKSDNLSTKGRKGVFSVDPVAEWAPLEASGE